MDVEKLIKCEKEAESGDGMSKLIIFCHKCFIEHTIVERDLKRLEIEASEGNYSSAYILFGYHMFFDKKILAAIFTMVYSGYVFWRGCEK